MKNKLEVGQRITALDLAQALEGQEGVFLAQQGGQAFRVEARAGHSIKSIIPVGRRFVETNPALLAQEPWTIERMPEAEGAQRN